MKLLRMIGMSFWIKHWFSRFKWYRRWHGGRWELWFIDICSKDLWLEIEPRRPDDYRQPCSFGPRMQREDWNQGFPWRGLAEKP